MRWRAAPAKVNLTQRVVRRRGDGYHDIESLVAFGDVCDWLGFAPGGSLTLAVEGVGRESLGLPEDNLVVRAARALAERVPGLVLGRFRLVKRLPAAAGLGGGSSDAAACLRALAEANGLSLSDERVIAAARVVGSDVPVCLEPRARAMTGVGDTLGPPVRLPPLHALLVNPRRSVGTRDVFQALGLEPGAAHPEAEVGGALFDPSATTAVAFLEWGRNDLEPPARSILPMIGDILERLRRLPGVRFARMSGSGATCFAIFDTAHAAGAARAIVFGESPAWWTAATPLR